MPSKYCLGDTRIECANSLVTERLSSLRILRSLNLRMTTTDFTLNPTIDPDGNSVPTTPNVLTERYDSMLVEKRLHWTTHYQLRRLLGSGGQGVVYLSERRGADNFTLPVALKIFSPHRYKDALAYDEAMNRMARVSARIAQIQHDNLLDVQNFVDRNRIRMLVMEWVDGYDLGQLLVPAMLDRIKQTASTRRWDYLNRVIVTAGPLQPRMKPGMAVAILRDCLGALAALHREGLVHGDIKPSNIMLKIAGNAKIVDIGAAFEITNPPPARMCTPMYAPPEVLEGNDYTARSDIASLGYVLIELLAGQSPFAGLTSYRDLLEANHWPMNSIIAFEEGRWPERGLKLCHEGPGPASPARRILGWTKQPSDSSRFPVFRGSAHAGSPAWSATIASRSSMDIPEDLKI